MRLTCCHKKYLTLRRPAPKLKKTWGGPSRRVGRSTDAGLPLELRLLHAFDAAAHGEDAAGMRLLREVDVLRPDRRHIDRVEVATAEGGHGRLLDRQVDRHVDLALGRKADEAAAVVRRHPVAAVGVAGAAV